MSPISKATGHFFHHLNFTVQPLSRRIGNAMPKIRQDILQMDLQGFGHLDERRQSRMSGPEIPALKELPGIFDVNELARSRYIRIPQIHSHRLRDLQGLFIKLPIIGFQAVLRTIFHHILHRSTPQIAHQRLIGMLVCCLANDFSSIPI